MLLRPGPYAPLIAGPAGGVRIAEQYSDGLISLYAPGMGGPGNFPDLRNLAESGGEFADPSKRVDASFRPFGPGAYIPTVNNLRRTTGRLWTPVAAGGFQPITILWYGAVISVADAFSGVYGYYGPSSAFFGFYTPGSVISLQARLSTTRTIAGTITRGVNSAICAVATMRSATDFAMAQAQGHGDLTNFTLTSSALSLGSAAVEPDGEDLSGIRGTGSWTEQDFIVAATWLRAMSNEEIAAIARNPMSILAPARALWSVELPSAALTAAGIATAAPTVGSPALAIAGTTVDLAADDVAAGAPVVGTPGLAVSDGAQDAPAQGGGGGGRSRKRREREQTAALLNQLAALRARQKAAPVERDDPEELAALERAEREVATARRLAREARRVAGEAMDAREVVAAQEARRRATVALIEAQAAVAAAEVVAAWRADEEDIAILLVST